MIDPKDLKKRLKEATTYVPDSGPLERVAAPVLSAYPANDWGRPLKLVGGTCWNRKGVSSVVVVDEEGRAEITEIPLAIVRPLFHRRPDGHLGAVGE